MKKLYGMRRLVARIITTLVITSALFSDPIRVKAEESDYSIMVNITKNVVTAYKDGEPVRAMICSSGAATHTSGTFKIPNKYRWHVLNGGVCGQYCSRISSHILFHSVPLYGWQNPGSLKPSYYDKLGTKASAGCIRLNVSDAKWIYENCPVGTSVTFYQDAEDPGPLGQPFFSPIGSFPSPLCNWDPTDPAENSPWNEYAGKAFDAKYYLENNPDLNDLGYYWTEDSLRHHWFTTGIKEGRRASAEFSFDEFKRERPDLYAKYGEDNYYAYLEAFNTGSVSKLTDGMGHRKMHEIVKTEEVKTEETETPAVTAAETNAAMIKKAELEDLRSGSEISVSGNAVDKNSDDVTEADTEEKTTDEVVMTQDHYLPTAVERAMEEAKKADALNAAFYGNVTPSAVSQAAFNAAAYADNNPDLKAVYGYDATALYNHYINFGAKEGRSAVR